MSRPLSYLLIALLLTALLATGLAAPTAQAAKPPAIEALSAHSQAYSQGAEASYRVGDLRISLETGVPVALYNLRYEVEAGTPDAMARQFLAEHRDLLQHGSLDTDDAQQLVLHAVRESDAGATVRYRQHYRGVPVYQSEVAVTLDPDHRVTFVMNGFQPGIELASVTPAVSAAAARDSVLSILNVKGPISWEKTEPVIFQHEGTWHLTQRVRIIPAVSPTGEWEGFIDATTGELLRLWDRAFYVDGSGTVFDPDPLSSATVAYGTTGYTDGGDADTAQLTAELFNRTLPDITSAGGMFSLVGPYAAIVDTESPFLGLFAQPSSSFNFTRNASGFEAANTYFHIDHVMRYLNEDLGVAISPTQYAGGARFDPHGLSGSDNSHYTSGNGVVAFGEGGVDDAEDADVVIHELGHALHDWVTGGALSQVNGLSEGIGDYVAQSYSRSLNQWTTADAAYHWVFSWDGHNPFWGGRITNYGAVYPGGLTGSIHTDGQIWATCMMKVWDAIGRDRTERAHWTGIGMTTFNTNQEDAAIAVQQAAVDLDYSYQDLETMAAIFQSCGYGVTGPNLTPIFVDGFEGGNANQWTAFFP
ncbi:MAG: peptidase [Acidobacteriota bacterium]|nr:peptidase [Acidobacteriota bacterium]